MPNLDRFRFQLSNDTKILKFGQNLVHKIKILTSQILWVLGCKPWHENPAAKTITTIVVFQTAIKQRRNSMKIPRNRWKTRNRRFPHNYLGQCSISTSWARPPGSSPPAEKPKPPSPPKPVEDDPMDFDFTIPIPPPPVEYRHRPYVFVYPELENDDGQDCSLETALHVADFDMNCEEVVSDDLHPESEWQISDPTYYGLTFKFVDRVIGGKVPTCEESDP